MLQPIHLICIDNRTRNLYILAGNTEDIEFGDCPERGGVLMSQINYADMSDKELRQYFLRHREDKMALKAYLDRLSDRPRNIITTVDDPDFDAKVQAAIRQRIQAGNSNA